MLGERKAAGRRDVPVWKLGGVAERPHHAEQLAELLADGTGERRVDQMAERLNGDEGVVGGGHGGHDVDGIAP